MIEALVFYMFATILVISSIMVITARNPVYSVLFLIVSFFNAAGLFILLGAEFVAMTLVIVYVGAIAVLFLFVVMMLNVGTTDLKRGFVKYVPVGALVGLTLLGELMWLYMSWEVSPQITEHLISPTPDVSEVSNTEALGNILYTDNAYLFQLSGLILLIAMIGAIVLTLRVRPEVRKQNISDQISRRREDSIKIKQVNTGEGV